MHRLFVEDHSQRIACELSRKESPLFYGEPEGGSILIVDEDTAADHRLFGTDGLPGNAEEIIVTGQRRCAADVLDSRYLPEVGLKSLGMLVQQIGSFDPDNVVLPETQLIAQYIFHLLIHDEGTYQQNDRNGELNDYQDVPQHHPIFIRLE